MITRRPLAAVGFLAPAIIIYLTFTIYPLIRGAFLSLTDSRGGPNYNFVGFANYAQLIDDPLVQLALRNTLVYAAIVVIAQNAIGVALARAIYNRPRLRPVLTVLILLPVLVAPVLAGFLFSYIYSPDGSLNRALETIGLGGLAHVWLGDPTTALLAVAVVNIWMYSGYSAAIFLAGYLGLSSEILDAATVDGASGWKRFRFVEWPLLAPSLTVNIILSLVGSLRVFEFPLVLTNGGPANSTITLTMVVVRNVFQGNQFAYGIAVAVLLLILIVIVFGVVSQLLRRRERNVS